MRFIYNVLAVFAVAPSAWGAPSTNHGHGSAKPAAFFLAGDSTTATGGGWGDGFLNYTVKAPAFAINYGHSGATTVSFRNGGDWATVLSQVSKYTETNEVFFGHNDQKPAANISIDQFAANLATFTDDVKALGGIPILVSSLTRRSFSGSPPRVIENLSNERNATLSVASTTNTRVIDLNRASTDYVNALGNSSWVYNLSEKDYTHLNERGSVVFGRLVSDLLVEKYEDIKEWTVPNKTLSTLIHSGLLG
ncbi:gdsl-like lipase acylhydrolase [Phlyctema vagabunda]|uniref:Gdsl-like lipase acylhydrolase n=1 Tax=Phlyctema vagabunda TaxID=108571 RepID=A0ABR4PU02_9HELO